jgi:hypothetical protein
MSDQIRRYQGTTLWIELVAGDVVERGVIDRAIVNGDRLAMDIRSEKASYAVSLRRSADGEYRGKWDQDRGPINGPASGRWTAHEDRCVLIGSWGHGTLMWGCVLNSVDSFGN